jgi:hypothetical protein
MPRLAYLDVPFLDKPYIRDAALAKVHEAWSTVSRHGRELVAGCHDLALTGTRSPAEP